MKRKLAIYGASAPDIVRLVYLINRVEKKWDDIVFLDDLKYKKETQFLKIPIVGNENDINRLKKSGYSFINNVASSIKAIEKVNKTLLDHNVNFANLIAPGVIMESVKIGKGTMIYPNVYFGSCVEIGDFTMVRANTVINHNVNVGSFCFFSAGVVVGGKVEIGQKNFFGMGALVRDNLVIGNNCKIGMGSVLVKNIPDDSIVYGNPAKNKS